MNSNIKSIDIVALAERENLQPKKCGSRFQVCCPFHQETKPSMFLFPDRNTFKCFGCGERGDAVDMVRKLHGLDFSGAMAYLGLKKGEYDKDLVEESRMQKRLVEKFRKWEPAFFDQTVTAVRVVNAYIKQAKSIEDIENIAEAVKWAEYIEHVAEVFSTADDRTKYAISKMKIRGIDVRS